MECSPRLCHLHVNKPASADHRGLQADCWKSVIACRRPVETSLIVRLWVFGFLCLCGLLHLLIQHHFLGLFRPRMRSDEHTSELQSLMRISYAVFCLKKKTELTTIKTHYSTQHN